MSAARSGGRDGKLTDLIDRAKLEKLYLRDGLSTVEIATRIGSNRETVRKLIHRYDIPMRSKGAGMAAKHRA